MRRWAPPADSPLRAWGGGCRDFAHRSPPAQSSAPRTTFTTKARQAAERCWGERGRRLPGAASLAARANPEAVRCPHAHTRARIGPRRATAGRPQVKRARSTCRENGSDARRGSPTPLGEPRPDAPSPHAVHAHKRASAPVPFRRTRVRAAGPPAQRRPPVGGPFVRAAPPAALLLSSHGVAHLPARLLRSRNQMQTNEMVSRRLESMGTEGQKKIGVGHRLARRGGRV